MRSMIRVRTGVMDIGRKSEYVFGAGILLTREMETFLGLGRFDHFHFRFGFGQFLTKNRGLGFPRFGFPMLTATFTSRPQPPDVASPDAPRRQSAFTSLV